VFSPSGDNRLPRDVVLFVSNLPSIDFIWGVIVKIALKTTVTSACFAFLLFCAGCGSGLVETSGIPNISQVLPQTITAGSKSVTMKVVGTNFTNKAVILWNGSVLTTSVVDSNTLSGTVGANSLALPSTAQLQVQDPTSKTASQAVSVTIAAAGAQGASSTLAIPATSLRQGSVGAAYSATLVATGGTPSYTWKVATGQLPAGLTLAPATGVLSGTPTISGNYSFGVSVVDSSSSVQAATATLTLSIAAAASAPPPVTSGPPPPPPPPPATEPAGPSTPAPGALTITSSALSSGVKGSAYSSSLQVSGGTAPYTWSSVSTLPAGLTLSAGGILAGTPTATGSASFMATVTDSSNSPQTQSTKISMVVAPAVLAIGSSTMSAGTEGAAYSNSMAVSGGTPAYTWKISAGTLPAGLNLAATTGVISGTPTATGTSKFTLSVSDNSIPAQTQSAAGTITIAAAQASAGTGKTWYVRPDGGTRYSSNVSLGQCDGTADVSYASTGGTGTNQHCAFNDVRYLWSDSSYTDGSTFPGWGWIGSGGDTYIIRGSIGTGVSYRVGWNSASTYCDATGCWGLTGNAPASGMPVPPSGTSGQHTRILGENYASCHSASAKTQLHGGWGVGNVLNLAASSYVDVACLDVTDFSACGRSSQSVGCDSTQDFAQIGLLFSNTSTHDTVTDVHFHGLAGAGIAGPTGDGVVLSYVDILGNASSGWNADLGDGTTGIGSLLVQNFNISWNGCAEEYPIVDAVPYGDCTDQSSGGYGDGFGTATVASAAPGWQVHFDQGTVSYNTQDGLDALHISGPGSTMTDTRVLAFGNEGQQLKVGGAAATIQNSVIVGNCEAMATQAIPGTPAGFGSKLGASCRAGNTAVLINLTPGDPGVFQYNTIYEAGSIGLEVEYATSDSGPTNTLQYNNNVFLGFYNSGAQANATSIYSNSDLNMLTNPGASWTNNATFGQRNNWPCPHAGESSAICGDPGLVDETYHAYSYGNMAPTPGSILKGAGVAIPGITVDYNGLTRKTPPSIGAYE
jgi:hypothetical protein